jgi:hypothetical protein
MRTNISDKTNVVTAFPSYKFIQLNEVQKKKKKQKKTTTAVQGGTIHFR